MYDSRVNGKNPQKAYLSLNLSSYLPNFKPLMKQHQVLSLFADEGAEALGPKKCFKDKFKVLNVQCKMPILVNICF